MVIPSLCQTEPVSNRVAPPAFVSAGVIAGAAWDAVGSAFGKAVLIAALATLLIGAASQPATAWRVRLDGKPT